MDAFVQRVQTADDEEHNGDDEAVDVADAAIAEVVAITLALRMLVADEQNDRVAVWQCC